MKIFQFSLLSLLLFATIKCNAADFPTIQATSGTFEISVSDAPYFLTYPINGSDGRNLYWLICFSGTDQALDKLSSETDINFVGPFACRLSTDNERLSETTLLAEHSGFSYWHTRGAFDFSEIEVGIADTHPKFEMKTDGFPEQLKGSFITDWSWSYWLFLKNISFG